MKKHAKGPQSPWDRAMREAIEGAMERRLHLFHAEFDPVEDIRPVFPDAAKEVQRLCDESFRTGYLARIEDELEGVDFLGRPREVAKI